MTIACTRIVRACWPRLVAVVAIALALIQSALALDTTDAITRAEAAGRHLYARQTEEGRFLYQFDFLAGRFIPGDNIVRQTGGGWVLAMLWDATRADSWRLPVTRAIAYYKQKSAPLGDGLIVSEDGTTKNGRAGATALALLTGLYAWAVDPDTVAESDLQSWLHGLQALQLPEGGFQTLPGTGEQEPYADGESWLALARYVDLFPNDARAQSMLERADRQLMSYYTANPTTQFSHWGLMAASQRLVTTGDKRFAEFLRKYVKIFVEEQRPEIAKGHNTCTIVEGLSAAIGALQAVDGDSELVTRLFARNQAELENNLGLQVREGQNEITLGQERYYHDAKIGNFAGGFLDSGQSLQMRIDSTQHCLSALIGYTRPPKVDKR